MKNMDELNDRQKEAVCHTDGPLLIIAGAGAGKTKTIVHRILHLIEMGVPPENILAITFTNKAAREMRERVLSVLGGNTEKRVRNFWSSASISQLPFISTFHALGVNILREYGQKIGVPARFSILDDSDSLSLIKKAIKDADLDPKQFEPRSMKSAISRHKGEGISFEKYQEGLGNEYFPKMVARVWQRYDEALKKEKALDFDDLLLKTAMLFREHKDILARYHNRFSHIHIDEYQDTNAIQYELSIFLAGQSKNICVVGDGDQCLISGTKVTMSNNKKQPIERVRCGDTVLSNYGSGDYRPARVIKVFTKKFSGDLVTITTAMGKKITSTPNHIHFAGYKLGMSPPLYFTYLMYKKGVGYRVGVSQVYTKGQRRSMVGFSQRCNHEHGDAVWVISAHKTQNEARIMEYKISLKYTLPTAPFVARKVGSKNGFVHDQKAIDNIFTSFDTVSSAKKLFEDLAIFQNYPHHRAQSRNSNRRNIVITLCGDRRGVSPMHRISIIGNDKRGLALLKASGLSVRKAKQNSKSWRVETARADYGELMKIKDTVCGVFEDANIILNARLGGKKENPKNGNSLPFLPASNVLPGMVLFNKNRGYDAVKKIERAKVKNITVYDIDIEKTHNFIANDLVTHNSIYSWRGADFRNIINFEKDYPDAKIVLLEENYRSTKTILSAANDIIKKNILRKEKKLFTNNKDGEKITLFEALDEKDEAGFVADKIIEIRDSGVNVNDIAILYRANFQSRILEEIMIESNIPYQVFGVRFFERKEIKDVLSYIKAAENKDGITDLKRAIAMPPRGIGKVTFAKIVVGKENELQEKTKEKVFQFRVILSEIEKESRVKKTSDFVKFVIEKSGIGAALKNGTDEDKERYENVMELVSVAKKYDILSPKEGLDALLADASLESDQDTIDEKNKIKDGVKLMTAHSSKGLEFKYVFITGLEQDLFPHVNLGSPTLDDEQKEEERRLFYVALTRAKEKLFLSYASIRMIFGARQANAPSEFLNDIDPSYIEIEQQIVPKKERLKTIYFD